MIKTRSAASAAFALLLFLPGLAPAQELPSADEVIDRYVEAIGGRDAVLSKEGSRSLGTFAMPAAGIEAEMEILTNTDPLRVLTRIEIPGMGTILNGYDGEVGWSMDPTMGPRLLDGQELAATVEGSRPEAAVRDASLFETRETVERTEEYGEACYKVRLVWESGRETFDCYSEETGLLVATVATQESPMGSIEAVTLMADYEDFDGVLTPTRMTQRAMGQEQVFTLTEVEYGALDPSVFELPAPIQTLKQAQQEGAEAGGGR